jgi:hypothetical protein
VEWSREETGRSRRSGAGEWQQRGREMGRERTCKLPIAGCRLQIADCRFQTAGGGWEWKWKAEVQGEGEGARDAWVVLPKGNRRWSCGGAGRAGRANAKASSSPWRQAQQQEGATVGLGQPEVATRVCGRAMYFQAQARYAMTVPSRPIWAGSSKASLNKK